MSRVHIELPFSLPFQTRIPVRITDLNYGGHVGNDRIVSLLHEARVLYLASFGYTELNAGGVSLIMADLAIEYKKELFYGDELLIAVGASGFTASGFELVYKLEKASGNNQVLVAKAKTGMVCYDYKIRKVVRIPEHLPDVLNAS